MNVSLCLLWNIVCGAITKQPAAVGDWHPTMLSIRALLWSEQEYIIIMWGESDLYTGLKVFFPDTILQ